MLFLFAAPIQFNPVLKYSATCLLYARGFFDKHFQDSVMYLRKTFLIMYSCTVLHIFPIKNMLLPMISSIICSNPFSRMMNLFYGLNMIQKFRTNGTTASVGTGVLSLENLLTSLLMQTTR